MAREEIHFIAHYGLVMEALMSRGLLLASYDAGGKPNVMTIGWGTLGEIWGLPLWVVLVRPSRYTYGCINASGAFSVNVPTADMHDVCMKCGTTSGRDVDKFAEYGLTAEKSPNANAPVIAECPITYECQVVHSNDVIPANLAEEVMASAYSQGDFHRVYFGKAVAIKAAPEAAELLAR